MTRITTRGFELHAWQVDAIEAWARGDRRPYTGTLEIVTGGGKTLMALACAERVAAMDPETTLVVVVPTEALAHQWREMLERFTNLESDQIGLLGAGGKDRPGPFPALVAVLNSAAARLPELATDAQPMILIIDECHRAGAPTFSRVLKTPAQYRLGLSATPEREELDETGEPLRYEDQIVGKSLGRIVYSFSLRDAQVSDWLPEFEIHHHGIALTKPELLDYEAASRRVDDLISDLRAVGVDAGRAQQLQSSEGSIGDLARSFVAATTKRKDLLYRADERHRVAERIVGRSLEEGKTRVLLFHERVAEAEELADRLTSSGIDRVALEHSRRPTKERSRAMEGFRLGKVRVLVSVKSLVEGIDVPEADVGVSVASSSSVRQRIQSLGRVLRRQFDDESPQKLAQMHLIYVADTVDEAIYGKEDWADLTGSGSNHYWRWELEGDPVGQEGPPATPRPTEEQEWERLKDASLVTPQPWLGVVVGQEYSVDTLGTVTNTRGEIVANPQRVADMIEAVRGRRGGRFRITPTYRFVLVWSDAKESDSPYVAGRLVDPFEIRSREADIRDGVVDLDSLNAGDPYPGPDSRTSGTFKLSQKRGGVIERQTSTGSEFALLSDSPRPDLEENARRVLGAWEKLFDRGITFYLSESGHAWYVHDGERRFLAEAPGGFMWPSMLEGTET